MPKPQPFLRLCEIHDRNSYKAVINSLGSSTTDENYKAELNECLKTIKNNKKEIKYFYKLIGKTENYGRLYAEGKCFQTMPSHLRGHFCNVNYVGLDISNAHPNLIRCLFKYYKIECKEIDEYCENKDEINKKYGTPRTFMNMICNCELYPIEKVVKKTEGSEFFKNVKSKVYEKLIYELIRDYPELYLLSTENKKIKNKKDKKDDNDNINGAFIANFLMTLENKIILACYNTLKKDYSIDSIIHDEILIKKTDNIDEICDKLKNIVKNTDFMGIPFDFDLNFKISKYSDYEPFKEALDDKKKEIEIANEGEPVKKTDSEIGQELALFFKDKIFKYSDDIYTYNSGVWKKNSDEVLKNWILGCGITRCDGDSNKDPTFICDETSHVQSFINQFKAFIMNNFTDDIEKFNMLNNQVGIIPFFNGYYDIINKEFLPYDDENSKPIYFTHKIMRVYRKIDDFEEIRRILLDIFDTEELMSEVMGYFARALAGHVEDKLWLNMVGERDSGKGMLNRLLLRGFCSFIGLFNSGDITLKKSFESTERKNGFLSAFCNSRLVICSEVPTDVKFDGTLIKTCASGGDDVRFRESHERLEISKIRALMCIMGQSIPQVEPRDALDNALICNMPCKFIVEKEPVEEDDNKAEDDEIKIKNGFIAKKADLSLKNRIMTDDKLVDSFVNYLFTFYENNIPKYKILRDSVKEVLADEEVENDPYKDVMKYILKKYDITNNVNDKIKRSDLNNEIKRSVFQTATSSKLITFMNANGIQSRLYGGTHYYRGLKLKEDDCSEFQ